MLLLTALSACSPEPTGLDGEGPIAPELAASAEAAPGATPGWSATVESAIAAGEYAAQLDGATFRATNRAQGLRASFGERGLAVTDPEGAHEVTLTLSAWGREGALVALDLTVPEEGPCLSDGAVDAFGACLRRVDYARPGLVEWWENRPGGLEQGFTVTAPPDGEGALVFELAVVGASVEVEGDEALLRREGGEALRYAGLVAFDEAGRELPAWIEESEAGLRLLVDDDGAVGTVTVDPLLTTAHWTAESDQASAYFGFSVASAGDVNGDGYGDLVVGALYYDNGSTDEGRAYLYLGSSSGLSASAAWTAESDQASAYFGSAVASAGDVNGDGYADVVVGAYGYDNGSTDEGRAFVYLGSSSGLATSAAWTAESDQASAYFGRSAASAGDVNGDGYGDVVVGAYKYDNGATDEGRAYVYLGSASGLSSSAAWTAESDQDYAWLGNAVASAGDVNGDGYGDVAVGVRYYDNGESEEGRVYVYLGSSSGLATSAAWSKESDQTAASFGASVASAGDVNGDGYGDLVVGAHHYDNGSSDEGRAFLYLGSASGLASSASWTAESDQASGFMGISVASAGDVNGDGFGDVVVGADNYSNGESAEGRAYVYLGSSSGLGTSASWTAESDQASANFGNPVASAGDVNGDGFGDVVGGALLYDGGSTDEGRVTVYLGSPSGLGTSAAWGAESDQYNAYFGYSVASAGDVNGDGYGDVVVSAVLLDNGSTDEGRAYVYLGSSSGLSTSASWSAEPDQADAYFGSSVASAGDVNGDGYGDVVVGAYGYDNGSTNEGRVYVYLGSSSGLSTSASWTAESDQAHAYFGISVASAGDVDGDGYGDVVVGAYRYDEGSTDEGRVYVYLGSSSGLSASAAWTAESDQAGADFGYAVASAGDVNGDGYGDVLVGAPNYDGGSTDEGRAYVYLGSSSGLATSAAWTEESDQAGAYFGFSVASAGDVDGDGHGDVAVGAYAHDNGSTDEGRASVYLGSSSGLSTSASWTAESDQAEAWFGHAVSSAGDVNGDGYGDVVVGAPKYDNGSANEGRASVYLGSSSGLSTSASWTAEPDQAVAYFGYTVASAGDVNGDGYGDVMAGAFCYDGGLTDEGRVFVYMGNGADGTTPLARSAQARSPGGTTPIVPGLASTSSSSFDVSMAKSRGAWGRARVRLQVEAKPLGTAFDGTDLDYTTTYTSSSTSGVALQETVDDLDVGTGYHWRARVQVSPAEGRPQAWGPWMYGGLPGDTSGGHTFTAAGTLYVDADGDGYGDPASATLVRPTSGYVANGDDCDDDDAAIHPAATELCDAADTDEDCDTLADDADTSATGQSTFYADADADGYGGATTGSYCDLPSGFVATSTDCDDSAASTHPGATEVCDGSNTDEDCDTLADDVDTSATGKSTFYVDADSDGYGGATTGSYCDLPFGYVATSTDCDDADAAISPAATEVCDTSNTDEDCDTLADDADTSATGKTTYYRDADSDGYGGSATGAYCDLPSGYVATSTDCDDGAASVHPAATEVCDAADTDEDCDTLADDADTSATGKTTYYRDADADGYGGATTGSYCDLASGYVATSTDCDDTIASVHPGATEVCDAADTDEDCDTLADDDDASATGQSTFYADADADGYGGATTGSYCDLASGFVATSTDCDDTTASVHPGATDAAGDAVDADCDGAESCYIDADEDGARTAFLVASSDTDCSDAGEALASADPDCDDADAAAYPGAGEVVADEIDQDCDGGETCYVDVDGDGYLADTSTVASTDADCADAGEAPATALAGDCDDGSAAYNPGASETDCTDPSDYNCDGSVVYADADADGWAACAECDDGDATVNPDATEVAGDGIDGDCDGVDRCYVDADADGYRTTDTLDGTTMACDGAGEAAVTAGEDCDDGDAAVSPAATDAVGDELDQDCDGGERCWSDADADRYRASDGTVTLSDDADCADAGEASSAVANGDCDDTDPSVSPVATETVADGVDQDCDGGDTCYADADVDGFAAADGTTVASTDLACDAAGESDGVAGGDCDDTDAAVIPDAAETAGDEVDGDCDGAEVCYADADGDGYTDATEVDSADADCDDAGELAADQGLGDCDDADAAYHPGADESDCADPADYNCDGTSGYADADGDGFAACEECDDADAAVNPAATEIAGDAVDQDCDDAELCYADVDADGARDTTEVASADADCGDAGEALASAAEDCDDADATAVPGGSEVVGDGIDGDCDRAELCYVDGDGDGYRADGGATVESADLDCAGAGEAADTVAAGDCDDASAAYNPGAAEDDCADPADYNCDGSSGYADGDGDGWAACEECDDAKIDVNPDAEEVCNGVDDDCDNAVDDDATDASTWYADADGDGFTDPDVTTTECDEPEGYAAATEDDCDDDDATAFPGGDDVPDDGVDQDCDGEDATAGDTDVPDEGTGNKAAEPAGCGCATGGADGVSLAAFGLLLVLVSRRRAGG